MDILEKKIDAIASALKKKAKSSWLRLTAYFRRLLFPLYLFPIKLLTYSAYYLLMFLLRFIVTFVKILFDLAIYPFRGLRNFLKSLFILGLLVYVAASLFVIADYLGNQYGYVGKFFCSAGVREKMQQKVVRVVGGYSEGTGFFISPKMVITNFHVIADEPTPKIIFPNGYFVTPVKMEGHEEGDMAILYLENDYPEMVLPLPDVLTLRQAEPLLAVGYPLGTEISGKATVLKGEFMEYRKPKRAPVGYIQTDINLVNGMSGGPLVDQCGALVGINTQGVAGLSMYINAAEIKATLPTFTAQQVAKIVEDPSSSPESAVTTFYTYLKARRMKDGFALLSSNYLKKTNFTEWTNRFTDILDVDIVRSKPLENSDSKVDVKFTTKNWVDGEVEMHFYEGVWDTVREDGVYKMDKSMILEVFEPGWEWYYE